MRDVSRLVILNYLLDGAGDRYASFADHLSETGRVQAKTILQSQREALLHRIRQAIQVAYDVESPLGSGDVVGDASHPEVLASLTPSFTPRPSAGGTLKQAYEYLVREAFSATYPAHPRFEPGDEEVRPRELQAAYSYVDRALADRENRVPLGPRRRGHAPDRQSAGRRQGGRTHFLMGDEYFAAWGPEFERRLGSRDADARGPVTVGEVRGWIAGIGTQGRTDPGGCRPGASSPGPRCAVAPGTTTASRSTPLKPGALRDDMELRQQPMPDEGEWATAIRLAGSVFGLSSSTHATPSAVANLAQAVRTKAIEWSEPSARLVTALESAGRSVGLDESRPNQRLATARAAADLCDVLRGLNGLPTDQAARRCGHPPADGHRPVAGERGRCGQGDRVLAPLRAAHDRLLRGGRAGRRGRRDPEPTARGAPRRRVHHPAGARHHERGPGAVRVARPGQPRPHSLPFRPCRHHPLPPRPARRGGPASAGEAACPACPSNCASSSTSTRMRTSSWSGGSNDG